MERVRIRVLVQIACLPDERHITGQRCGAIPIMDADRVYAGHLDVHLPSDAHDMGACCATESFGDGATWFQADPYHAVAGNML